MEQVVDDLNGALETYNAKWMTVKTKNTAIIRKTDASLLTEKKEEVSESTIPESAMGAEYIRVTPLLT